MKPTTAILLILVLGFIFSQFLPWWIIVPIAALVGFGAAEKGGKSFAFGFLGVSLLWGGVAAYIYFTGGEIIANRMGSLLGDLNGGIMVVVTGLLGGVLGGLGSASGAYLRDLVS